MKHMFCVLLFTITLSACQRTPVQPPPDMAGNWRSETLSTGDVLNLQLRQSNRNLSVTGSLNRDGIVLTELQGSGRIAGSEVTLEVSGLIANFFDFRSQLQGSMITEDVIEGDYYHMGVYAGPFSLRREPGSP